MSDSSDRSEPSPIPAERLEALVEAALQDDERAAANEAERSFLRMVRLVRQEIFAEATELPGGVPETAVASAKSLASILPRREQGVLRPWWDRAMAAIASCLHDDAATPAIAGLRRSGSVRQMSFATRLGGGDCSIDLEIEARLEPDRAAIRGQVTCEAGSVPPGATIALVRDGQALLTAILDEDGFFDLEAPAARWDLAIHLGEAGTVVLPDLDLP